MKDNMVQELLMKALLGQRPNTLSAQASPYQRQTTSNSMPGLRESLEALLKSLYLNNAQNLAASNIKNVNNLNQIKLALNNGQIQKENSMPQVFEKFMSENPDFFKEREILFEYLNSINTDFDADELAKIAKLTKAVEEAAIKRFCAKNPKYSQFLMNENSKFLNKLENSADQGVEGTLKSTPFYSASDIDKMSNEEFLKHKDEIDAQILNLIKNS